jgi:hypothetical protein
VFETPGEGEFIAERELLVKPLAMLLGCRLEDLADELLVLGRLALLGRWPTEPVVRGCPRTLGGDPATSGRVRKF